MKRFCFIIIMTLLSATFVFAGKPKKVKVKATATYKCERSDSWDDGLKKAIEAAKLEALTQEFGVNMNGQRLYNISTTNNTDYKSDFISTISSNVCGEWLSEPEVTYKDEMDEKTHCYVFHVTVNGYAREIVRANAELLTSILVRPDDNPERECLDLKSGQYFYLYFKSPVSGYLLVYLLDENGKASRLLPYFNDDKSNVSIKSMKEYVFFDENNRIEGYENSTNNLYLYTNEQMVTNRIMIIFSENPIHKILDTASTVKLANDNHAPNETDAQEFMRYLGDLRSKDASVQVIEKVVSIKNR